MDRCASSPKFKFTVTAASAGPAVGRDTDGARRWQLEAAQAAPLPARAGKPGPVRVTVPSSVAHWHLQFLGRRRPGPVRALRRQPGRKLGSNRSRRADLCQRQQQSQSRRLPAGAGTQARRPSHGTHGNPREQVVPGPCTGADFRVTPRTAA